MTKANRKLRNDCIEASKALVGWFESQGLSNKQAIGVMALTIAAIIAEDGQGDMVRTIGKYDLTARLIEAELVQMALKKQSL